VGFYVGKVLELVGITSLGVGLVIGLGNHTGLASPLGPMSPGEAMGVELSFFLAGLAFFAVGFYLERRARS
jgi:hypothetical protein